MSNELDYIIEKGTIYDGTGKAAFQGDIGISGDRIEAVGDLSQVTAKQRIDAQGYWVCPGFIDAHTHTDVGYSLTYPGARGKIMQGVTTDVSGLCGGSAAPFGTGHIEETRTRQGDNPNLAPITVEEYISRINQRGNSTNIAMQVGNANLRIHSIGYENRKASPGEMDSMQAMLKEAMEQGAFGLSTGLTYVPSQYADTQELIDLCKVIAPYGGIYNSHMRNESDFVLDSIKEVIEITEKSGCLGHISHLKASGLRNHGKSGACLELIHQANDRGIPVTFDVYAYTAGSVSLNSLLPAWVLSHGFGEHFETLQDKAVLKRIQEDLTREDWENTILSCGYPAIFIGAAGGLAEYEGKSLTAIAHNLGISEFEAFIQVLIDSKGQATIIQHSLEESDLETFIKSPYCTIGTDAYSRDFIGPTATGKPHPRNYGGLPRFLRRYVLDKKLVSPETGIHMVTGKPASIFHLKNRGILGAGNFADITVIDPQTIKDTGDYMNPAVAPDGIEYVFVNGRMALEQGQFVDVKAGKALKIGQ